MMALAGTSAAAMIAAFGGSAMAQTSAYNLDLGSAFAIGVNPLAAQQDYNLIVTFDQLVLSPSTEPRKSVLQRYRLLGIDGVVLAITSL